MVCALPQASEKRVKNDKAESRASFLPKTSLSLANMMGKPGAELLDTNTEPEHGREFK